MEKSTVQFQLQNDFKRISNEDILNDVKKVLNLLKKEKLTEKEYHQHGVYGRKAIRNHFGGWNNLLRHLNIPQNVDRSHLSKEDIFNIIRNLWDDKGAQPTLREFEGTHHTKKIIISNFGSWMNCLREFVEFENKNQSKPIITNNIKHKTKRDVSLSLRYEVLKRDHFKCVICGRSPSNDPSIILHVDHIIPYSKGGETEIHNLQTLCQHCNLGKGSK